MNGCKVLTCLLLLTSRVLKGQDRISVTIKTSAREYEELSCTKSKGMIHGKDKFSVTIKAAITGLNTPYKATFGLSAVENGAIPIGTSLEAPFCPHFPEKPVDTCICVLMEINEIHFTCHLVASCKLNERLYFYMYHNNTYYNSDSFSVPKVYARCEDPPGPFAACSNRMPKRVVTYPYDPTNAPHHCEERHGILNNVDIFKMMGRVALLGIPSTTRVFVNFGVVHRTNKNSSTFLGTTINFNDRDCPPIDHYLVDSCTCLGDEIDEFRVVCTLMASIEHSEKTAFFFLHTDGQDFYGDFVKMPKVLNECGDSSGTSVLEVLLYIFLFLVFVVSSILSYIYVLKPYYDKILDTLGDTKLLYQKKDTLVKSKKTGGKVPELGSSVDQRVSEFIGKSSPIHLDDDTFTL